MLIQQLKFPKQTVKLTTTVLNGSVIVPATEYDVKDNGDGTATVTAKADSKSYTGSQKVSVKKSENVGAPVISNVKVVGNKATVILLVKLTALQVMIM